MAKKQRALAGSIQTVLAFLSPVSCCIDVDSQIDLQKTIQHGHQKAPEVGWKLRLYGVNRKTGAVVSTAWVPRNKGEAPRKRRSLILEKQTK